MDQTGQERAVNSFFAAENEKKESFLRKLGRIFAKLLILLAETVLLAALVLYAGMYILAKGPSPAIRKIFVTSVRETSAIGFLADLYFSEEEIEEIEAVKETREYAPTDTTLFTVGDDSPSADGVPQPDEWGLVDEDGDGIIVEQINGAGYSGYMMVVLDPWAASPRRTAPAAIPSTGWYATSTPWRGSTRAVSRTPTGKETAVCRIPPLSSTAASTFPTWAAAAVSPRWIRTISCTSRTP